MPIVIKEVIVKTTVEQDVPQWLTADQKILNGIKQEILEELREEEKTYGLRRGSKR